MNSLDNWIEDCKNNKVCGILGCSEDVKRVKCEYCELYYCEGHLGLHMHVGEHKHECKHCGEEYES